MCAQAKITSLEALESFRASLIVFISKAHNCIDEATDQIRRTRHWLQHEQRVHWENRARLCRRRLDQAEQDLLSAKLSSLRDNITAQQSAVLKARRELAEAEQKIRMVKLWTRDFDSHCDPLQKRLESLRQFLDFDLPKALAFLLQAQKTLDAYSSPTRSLPPQSAPPSEPSEEVSPE